MTDHQSEDLDQLKNSAIAQLQQVVNAAELEAWRIKFIGRKGKVPLLLRSIKEMPERDRRAKGQRANELRANLNELYQEKKQTLAEAQDPADMPVDSYPALGGAPPAGGGQLQTSAGHLHPLSAALRRAREIFAAMGFFIVEGPEIEEAKYNFDQLNISFEHPARAATDTFYLQDLPDLVLRTHVSTLQIRGVLENDITPPFKMMYYGPSYRSEKEDATHLSLFQQYEFMVVDETVSLADLRAIIETFYSLFFEKDFEFRFRPAYYPFVEPGLDVDMRDKVTGKGQWLEMAGAGMVHPNVLRNINVDPDKYQGIALGGGLDRLAMLKHGIPDARLFYSGDIRFLNQFN